MKLFTRNRAYVLMHKDIPVLEGNYSTESHQFTEITEVLNWKHLPIGVRKNDTASLKRLNYWYMRRSIPGYRVGLAQLLNKLSVSHPMELVEYTHAVSVSDTYWLKKENEDISWETVSFFHHSFAQNAFAKAMFSSFNEKAEDKARYTPNNNTAGFHRKAWMKRSGSLYLLKGGYPFYQMEPVNEWITHQLAETIGASSLAYETEVYENALVSVCPCFTDEDTDLVTAEMILMECDRDESSDDVLVYMNECRKHGIHNVRKKISDQMLLDYLMMNTDRHAQNMGVLVNANTMEWKDTAPVFDTGTGLGCLVKDDEILLPERYEECTLLNKRNISFEELLKYTDLSLYDFSSVLDLPREYGNRLVRYQSITHISDNRIEAAYTLFYKQLLKIRKLQKQI